MGVNVKKLINEICDQKVDANDLGPKWKKAFEIIHSSKIIKVEDRPELKTFLLLIYKKGKFFNGEISFAGTAYPYLQALIKVFERKGQWIRAVENWKPSTHNSRRQFGQLLRYLFAKYELPAFMDYVWFRTERGAYRYRNWFIHLSSGANLRSVKSKIKITKKVAHYFGTAPEDYTVEQALWWGIIFSQGGGERLAKSFLNARPSHLVEDQDFWNSFLAFMIKNPMIDLNQMGPIVDFINFQKFDLTEVYENGEIINKPPPQPNFSMKKRNPNTLLEMVNRWHNSLEKIKLDTTTIFQKSKTKGLNDEKRKKNDKKSYWRIYQLRTNLELQEEGRTLKHCVASYSFSCAKGRCCIWSLTRFEEGKPIKKITIEVDNRSNSIVQCRGKYNAMPSKAQLELIMKWAAKEKLTVSAWVG